MFLSSFDILRKVRRGKPTLLAVAGDLETACLRLRQLASLMPGEYFVFDPRTQQIVAALEASCASANLTGLSRASDVVRVGEG
jgi:sarcosine oxidase gamma subunit